MEESTYLLPAHWAPALINGDWTGMSERDEEQLMACIAGEGLPDAVSCSEESEFTRYHDARPYGVLSCECLTFTFLD